jgi:integrase/recombinase XerD
MARKHAEILSEKRMKKLLEDVVETNPQPLVMKAAFMLSFYGGLRVQEIAGLDWRLNVMNSDGTFKTFDYPVYDASGEEIRDADGDLVTEPVDALHIGNNIGKYGKARAIPLHDDLKEVLQQLFDEQRGNEDFPAEPHVIPSAKNGASQNLTRRAHALKMRINRIYQGLGLKGCSSHSGRRTFVTRGATRANTVGQSLRDIQVLAGHRNLVTTQAYIEPVQQHKKLVNAIWK